MEQEMFKPSEYDVIAKLLASSKGNTKKAEENLDKLKMLPNNMKEKVIVCFIQSTPNPDTKEFETTLSHNHFDETAWEKTIQDRLKYLGKGDAHILHDGRKVIQERRAAEAKAKEEAFKKASTPKSQSRSKADNGENKGSKTPTK